MWKPVKLADYRNEQRGGNVGRVYLASVRRGQRDTEAAEYNGDGPPSVCLELEDLVGTVGKQLGVPSSEDTLRVVMNLPGARMLCHNLIEALADSGDRVALQIRHMMRQAMLQVRANDEKLTPFQVEELKRQLGWSDGNPNDTIIGP